jgi:hypothetical protein
VIVATLAVIALSATAAVVGSITVIDSPTAKPCAAGVVSVITLLVRDFRIIGDVTGKATTIESLTAKPPGVSVVRVTVPDSKALFITLRIVVELMSIRSPTENP